MSDVQNDGRKVAFAAVLRKMLAEQDTAARDRLRSELTAGNQTILDDLGQPIGKVVVESPREPAIVTTVNEPLVVTWSTPDRVTEDVSLPAENIPEALAILSEHGAHLITVESRLQPWAREAVVREAEARHRAGEEHPPGITTTDGEQRPPIVKWLNNGKGKPTTESLVKAMVARGAVQWRDVLEVEQ
jgi:hypothetical protein